MAADIAASLSNLPVDNPDPTTLSDLVLGKDLSTLSDLDGSSSEYDEELVDDAQAQWDENLANLERTLYLILCPMIGKVIGRRIAQNIWIKFVDYRWNRYQWLSK